MRREEQGKECWTGERAEKRAEKREGGREGGKGEGREGGREGGREVRRTWETSSITSMRTLSPRRLLFFFQKEMSLWKARNSKRRWSLREGGREGGMGREAIPSNFFPLFRLTCPPSRPPSHPPPRVSSSLQRGNRSHEEEVDVGVGDETSDVINVRGLQAPALLCVEGGLWEGGREGGREGDREGGQGIDTRC
jgi:hypothetical protein